MCLQFVCCELPEMAMLAWMSSVPPLLLRLLPSLPSDSNAQPATRGEGGWFGFRRCVALTSSDAFGRGQGDGVVSDQPGVTTLMALPCCQNSCYFRAVCSLPTRSTSPESSRIIAPQHTASAHGYLNHQPHIITWLTCYLGTPGSDRDSVTLPGQEYPGRLGTGTTKGT